MEFRKNENGKAVAIYTASNAWECLQQLATIEGTLDLPGVLFQDDQETGELECVEIEITPENAFDFLMNKTINKTKKTTATESGKGKQNLSAEGIKQQERYLAIGEKAKELKDEFTISDKDEYDFLKKLFASEYEYKVRGIRSKYILQALVQFEIDNKIQVQVPPAPDKKDKDKAEELPLQ